MLRRVLKWGDKLKGKKGPLKSWDAALGAWRFCEAFLLALLWPSSAIFLPKCHSWSKGPAFQRSTRVVVTYTQNMQAQRHDEIGDVQKTATQHTSKTRVPFGFNPQFCISDTESLIWAGVIPLRWCQDSTCMPAGRGVVRDCKLSKHNSMFKVGSGLALFAHMWFAYVRLGGHIVGIDSSCIQHALKCAFGITSQGLYDGLRCVSPPSHHWKHDGLLWCTRQPSIWACDSHVCTWHVTCEQTTHHQGDCLQMESAELLQGVEPMGQGVLLGTKIQIASL